MQSQLSGDRAGGRHVNEGGEVANRPGGWGGRGQDTCNASVGIVLCLSCEERAAIQVQESLSAIAK